jgi:hypothetical protein
VAVSFSIKNVFSRVSYLLQENNLQICVIRVYGRNNFKAQENLNVSHFKSSIRILILRSHIILSVLLKIMETSLLV